MKRFADKPIVAPVDFTDESDHSVDLALDIAGSPEFVTVLHVAPPLVAFEPAIVAIISDEERREQILAAARSRFSDAKYRGIHFDTRFGDPAHEIADAAQEKSAGLIVMPSHGRTGLAHLLMGSVAERVVRLAHCPVLVLRS